MSKGLVSQNLLAGDDGVSASIIFGASKTAVQVGRIFQVTAKGSLNMRVDLVADTVTAGAGITWKLQSSSGVDKDGADNWIDFGAPTTVAITTAASTTLALNVQDTTSDEGYLPLRPKGRIVITTGAGSTVTVEQLRVTQAQ